MPKKRSNHELKRYQGEVSEVSAGRDISAERGGGSRREYVVIGESRVRNVLMSDYLEGILSSAKGQLELSVVEVRQGKSREPERILAAIKLPSGEIVKEEELLDVGRASALLGAVLPMLGPSFGCLGPIILVGTLLAGEMLLGSSSFEFALLVGLFGASAFLYMTTILPRRSMRSALKEAMEVFDLRSLR